MTRTFAKWAAALVVGFVLPAWAPAVVVERTVTPASVKEQQSRLSIDARKSKAGLVEFTITLKLTSPQYLVAHFEVRDGETVLARADTPAFVRENSATYHIAVSQKHMATSKFELSEHSFADSGGQPIAMPGGTIFKVDLAAFAAGAADAEG